MVLTNEATKLAHFIRCFMYCSALEEIITPQQLSMAQVASWLLKYSSVYKEACRANEQSALDTLYLPGVGEIKRLAFTSEVPDYLKFISVFEELVKLAEYHKYEAYFSTELASYYQIAKAPGQVKKWLRKNIPLGTDKFLLFAAEYRDYEGNEEFGEDDCPLSPYFMFMPEAKVFINRNEFVNTLTFIEIFHQRFYVDKLLPEN